jgi:hypothetical protein
MVCTISFHFLDIAYNKKVRISSDKAPYKTNYCNYRALSVMAIVNEQKPEKKYAN